MSSFNANLESNMDAIVEPSRSEVRVEQTVEESAQSSCATTEVLEIGLDELDLDEPKLDEPKPIDPSRMSDETFASLPSIEEFIRLYPHLAERIRNSVTHHGLHISESICDKRTRFIRANHEGLNRLFDIVKECSESESFGEECFGTKVKSDSHIFAAYVVQEQDEYDLSKCLRCVIATDGKDKGNVFRIIENDTNQTKCEDSKELKSPYKLEMSLDDDWVKRMVSNINHIVQTSPGGSKYLLLSLDGIIAGMRCDTKLSY